MPAVAVPAPIAMPSDPRAEFVEGNVMTCAQLGLEGSIRLGGSHDEPGADAYVSVTTREQRFVDVAITSAGVSAGVVIDAVVVKGGDGFNLYTNPAVLPPALLPPQDYVSPLVGAGNIAQISHWFVCYHFDALPTGSLLVDKDVIPPPGLPVDALPISFSVLVTCDAPGFVPVVLTFGRAGGVALSADSVLIEDLPVGTTCTIEEQDTDGFPAGTVVSFSPDSTVQIGDTEGVEVVVTNDFSGIAILQGSLTITKVVESTLPPAEIPAEFVVEYACLDGVEGSVTLPETGGTSAPIVTTAGTYCAIAEATASLPPGWTVIYQSGDQTSTTDLIVHVFDTPVTVTVTNTSPSPPPSPSPSPTDPGAPELAESGGETSVAWGGVVGAALLFGCGIALARVGTQTRERRRS
ncbi:DUF5979 domain-containing protein [Microbacterium immunditiarum]|uniref:DUF5979 domain-containing protein n=1 Tax=Microbacterium immunditiarum TaxID=337480 RepID=A0A7Y9KIX3_9MICO|nr:DUF5979 domain-containing protein [Microbacterium immunditiarum]NYE19210.1 hypothetical protein [Microbacterium immunditiarum]